MAWKCGRCVAVAAVVDGALLVAPLGQKGDLSGQAFRLHGGD